MCTCVYILYWDRCVLTQTNQLENGQLSPGLAHTVTTPQHYVFNGSFFDRRAYNIPSHYHGPDSFQSIINVMVIYTAGSKGTDSV